MIRNIVSILAVALVLTSCGNKGSKISSSEADGSAAKVEFASLVEHPEDFVGKNISVEGKVVHVCMHSGKKMFIVGENPDIRLFITAGEDMPKFPTELLGSQIVVEGTIEQSAPAAPAEQSAEKGMHAEGTAMAEASTDSCENEAALARQPALRDLMMVYNRHAVK
ncbi:MAG: hypothetical protein R6W81_01490 [Bacteroidales bacterium]